MELLPEAFRRGRERKRGHLKDSEDEGYHVHPGRLTPENSNAYPFVEAILADLAAAYEGDLGFIHKV